MQHLSDLKQETSLFVGIPVFYEQLKFRAQFITSRLGQIMLM